MKINISNISKKFNLIPIKDIEKDKEVEISEFARKDIIENSIKNDFALVVIKNMNIESVIDKCNLILVCDASQNDQDYFDSLLKFKKIILYTNLKEREMLSLLEGHLLRKQQEPKRLHASMISVFGEGILITGKPAMGKSELTLELINRKHLFIGDDAIDVIPFANQILAWAPKLTRGFIEVRGVGIINAKGMFGIQSMIKQHVIDLVIELVNLDDNKDSIERLGLEHTYVEIVGIKIPKIQIPLASGRPVASVVEAAVISFKQRKYDKYIAAEDFNKKLKE